MPRRRRAVLLAAGAACALLLSACAREPTAAPSAPAVPAVTVAGVRLLPLTRPERAACRRIAATTPVPVLCPTRLPRAAPATPAARTLVLALPACRALGRPRGCPLYDLAVMYGAPDESPGGARRNRPGRFLHVEVLGGRGVAAALGLRSHSGLRPLQRLAGRPVVAGRRGRLYAGLPYRERGGEYGGHLTCVWRTGSWVYAVSLHAWAPRRAALRVLQALVAGVRQARA